VCQQIVADLVTVDRNNDEYVLYFVEEGPWPAGQGPLEDRLASIRCRVLGAVAAVAAGALARRYHGSEGKRVRIQADAYGDPPRRLEESVREWGEEITAPGAYADALARSPHVAAVRIVTRAMMGPPAR
jgi:hypothetical protein